MMILSKFILQNIETILQEWEDFAATLVPVEQKMDQAMLRDHGKQMLEAIAADLLRPETARKKADKSKGHGDAPGGKATAAKTHGADRLASGFTLNAAVAEYRALRASVIRLWQEAGGKKPVPSKAINDLIRFSEAIDQAISLTFDLEGRFAYANKALIEFLKLPLDKIVGKTFVDLELPAASELQRQIQAVMSTKEKVHGEMPYTTASGEWRFYDYIFVPVLRRAR
jgi:PAS domain-containing protein